MSAKQHELDQFSNKGKQLMVELKKIPDCDTQIMKKDMEMVVDQWLDVSLTNIISNDVRCIVYIISRLVSDF